MIEVDKCPCLDFEEASKIERNYIEKLNATLNIVIPLQTQKEYYEKNKGVILEQKQKYFENNKDVILEKRKRKITCECGCVVSKTDLAKHKKTQKHLQFISVNLVSSV